MSANIRTEEEELVSSYLDVLPQPATSVSFDLLTAPSDGRQTEVMDLLLIFLSRVTIAMSLSGPTTPGTVLNW